MTMKLIFITTALLASSFSVIGSFGKDQDPKLFITDDSLSRSILCSHFGKSDL
jgi:hypothetical protein